MRKDMTARRGESKKQSGVEVASISDIRPKCKKKEEQPQQRKVEKSELREGTLVTQRLAFNIKRAAPTKESVRRDATKGESSQRRL